MILKDEQSKINLLVWCKQHIVPYFFEIRWWGNHYHFVDYFALIILQNEIHIKTKAIQILICQHIQNQLTSNVCLHWSQLAYFGDLRFRTPDTCKKVWSLNGKFMVWSLPCSSWSGWCFHLWVPVFIQTVYTDNGLPGTRYYLVWDH